MKTILVVCTEDSMVFGLESLGTAEIHSDMAVALTTFMDDKSKDDFIERSKEKCPLQLVGFREWASAEIGEEAYYFLVAK